MKIQGVEKVTHPARQVFEALRDKTPELLAFMPNIEAVEVLERREEDGVLHLLNRWQGTKADVPKALRPFASREMTSWMDYAAWNSEELSCRWRIEAAVASRMFRCEGKTTIDATGDEACTFRLAGELTVDPAHIPGVPRFLAKKLKSPLERFIIGAVTPNLTGIAKAVQRYLDLGR